MTSPSLAHMRPSSCFWLFFPLPSASCVSLASASPSPGTSGGAEDEAPEEAAAEAPSWSGGADWAEEGSSVTPCMARMAFMNSRRSRSMASSSMSSSSPSSDRTSDSQPSEDRAAPPMRSSREMEFEPKGLRDDLSPKASVGASAERRSLTDSCSTTSSVASREVMKASRGSTSSSSSSMASPPPEVPPEVSAFAGAAETWG